MNAPKRLVNAAARIVLPTPDPKQRRVILCYHSIHPSASHASATPSEFDRHLDWLQGHCNIEPLERIRDEGVTGRPRVALTFDDGFADNWQYALPRLKARGLTATFFLTVGFLEQTPAVMARMAELWGTSSTGVEPLRWDHVTEMRTAGMSLGSHTMSHPNLAALDVAEAEAELYDSKRRLEDRLQEPVTSLAYPFGKLRHHVTPHTVELARRCGYERAVVTLPRAVAPSDDQLRLPRLVIGNDDVSQLTAKVWGAIDWHAHVRERLPRALSELSLPGRR